MSEPINAKVANLIRQANAAAAAGDLPGAQLAAQEAVEKANLSQHSASRIAAHYTLATMLWSDEAASIEQAHFHAHTACELAIRHSDEYYLTLTLLTRIEAGLGHFERARQLNTELLESFQRKNRVQGIADALRTFGDIALKCNDLVTARQYFEQSLALYRDEIHDPLNLAGLLLSLGSLAFREGAPVQAAEYWQEASRLGESQGMSQITLLAQRSLSLLTKSDTDE